MIFVFGEQGMWELDDAAHALRHGGEPVPVQPKVLALLFHLVRNRDRVVPKAELLDVLWPNENVGESSLTRAVRGARRALEDSGERQALIQNARGRGYRFCAAVEERGQQDAPSRRAAGVRAGPFFVGREDLLGALEERLESAFLGKRQLLLLTGPPGIGKTRLIEVFAERASRRGAECLVGHCVEAEGAPPFWPWAEIVRSFARGRSPASLRQALGQGASDVAQAIPAIAEFLPELAAPPDIDAAQTRFRLHQSFAEFLRRACAGRPLVVILDDLHRADQASLGLLEHLARDLNDVGIAFVATLRDTKKLDPKPQELIDRLGRLQPESVRSLGGLVEEEIALFVERSTGSPPPEELVYSLADRTLGNPLFLGELLSRSSTEGAELPRASGVREAIRRHLEDLSAPCRQALQVAAVLGRDFELGVAARAIGQPTEQTLSELDEAVEAGVVQPLGAVGRFRFRHGLIPEVLVDELPSSHRVRLHDAVGSALLEHYGPDSGERHAEISHHFVEAAPAGQRQRAIDACRAAAKHAASVAAFADAARQLDAALGVLELGPSSPGERAALLIRAAERWTEAGELKAARERLRRGALLARATQDHAAFTRAALGSQVADESGQVDTERVSLLEEARASLAPQDSAGHVRVMAALAESTYFSEPSFRAHQLSGDAVEMARRVNDPLALTMALRARHVVLRHPEGLDERKRIAAELIELTEREGDREQLAHALAARFQDSLESGDRQAVDRDASAHAALTQELRQPYFGWHAELHAAALTLLAGDVEKADAHAHKALHVGQAIQVDLALQWYGVQIFLVRREQGRLEELRTAVDQLTVDFPVISTWPAALALIDIESGDLVAARRRLRHLVGTGLSPIRDDVNRLITLCVLAEVARAAEDAEAGALLESQLRPFTRRFVAIGLSAAGYGACSRYLAMAVEAQGRIPEAIDLYTRAISLDAAMGARTFEARGQVDLARVLLRRGASGDRDHATRLLAEAADGASSLGMVVLAEEARASKTRLQGAIPLPLARRK